MKYPKKATNPLKLMGLRFIVQVFLVASLFFAGLICVNASDSLTSDNILIGGELDDEVVGIVEAPDGGYVLAGTTYSFGAGKADFLLIKVDDNGNVDWNNTYGGLESDVANALTPTSDGGYVLAGETSSFGLGDKDFWLVKVDQSGNMEWNQTYGSSQTIAEAKAVIQTSDNGYVLTGFQEKNTTSSILMVKTDSLGNMQWNRTYQDNVNSKNVYSLVQSNDGGYAFSGMIDTSSEDVATDGWLVETDSEGIIQWNQTYDVDEGFDYVLDLVQISDGGYAFSGTTGGFFLRDVWIVKTDEVGNIVWSTVWDTAEPAYTSSLIKTNDGGFLVTGATDLRGGYYPSYMFMVKVDLSGNIQWNSTYEGLGDNKALFAIQTNDGGYALAGTTRLKEDGANYDIWFTTVTSSDIQIPEFPSWTPPLISLVAVMLVTVVYRKRLVKLDYKLCA